MEEPLKCSNCGGLLEVENDNLFVCQFCGAKTERKQPGTVTNINTSIEIKGTPKPQRSFSWLGFIIGFSIVFIVAALVVYLRK